MGVYSISTTVTPQKRDSSTWLGYMGPYGLTQTTGTGATDAWTYTYTTPDPATSVVELAHPGVRARLTCSASVALTKVSCAYRPLTS